MIKELINRDDIEVANLSVPSNSPKMCEAKIDRMKGRKRHKWIF